MIDQLKQCEETLKSLNRYCFEFGVFTEDEEKTVTVNIINPDETVTEALLTIKEVMYLTENGTIMLPAKPILERTLPFIDQKLDSTISGIIDDVFNFNINESVIESRLNVVSDEINAFIQQKVIEVAKGLTAISQMIGSEQEIQYIFDIYKLKNYIHFKIIKN